MAADVDPAEFRTRQKQGWDEAAAGWKKWSAMFDRVAAGVSRRLVELAGVQAGARVLDVAAGYGEPALTAAREVGSGGRVIATDISAEMLAFGRERATAAGLDNIEFVEMDASSLDYPAGFFDAALSRWGIIFDPDGEAAAARVREMLKGGGRFAISSWGPPERVPFLGIAVRTIEERHGLTLPPGLPGPMSRPTPDALAALLEGGGYAKVAVEETSVDFEFDSGRDFATYVRDIASPVRALIADQPPEVQEETWAAVAAAAPAQPDGSVRISNLVLLASGSA